MTARRHRLRVLVVENEVLLRLLAEEMLLDLGHEIVGEASTAQGAIAEAERTRPDIVLMDIQLDGKGDGIDAAREIRNRLGIASLFMTGCSDPDTYKRALLTQPLGYLRKPLSFADVDKALHRAIHQVSPHPHSDHWPQAHDAMEGLGRLLAASNDAALRMSGKGT